MNVFRSHDANTACKNRADSTLRRHLPSIGLILWSASTAGCGDAPPPPNLHPVRGVVVGLNGETVTNQGVIEFRSQTDPELRAVASFDESGRFELSSREDGVKHMGARTGSYQVTVLPSGAKHIPPILLPNAVKIAPQENELTIKIDTSRL